ncbi:MAG: chemotaxis protein CheB [Bacteroidetes bacterium]|nr:chemotaxis protein CheB [Bacteroidota bacterium]
MFSLKNKAEKTTVVIGGSAGSFPIVNRILEGIRPQYRMPVILCLHRLRDKREGFKEALEIKSKLPVNEPNDKSLALPGHAYVAPANYHLLMEDATHFALATTELVQYSRPSIDVLFESAADVCGQHLIAVLLSGANRDGATGMRHIKRKGGLLIVQDPQECSMRTMPEAALQATEVDYVLKTEDIIRILNEFH